MDSSNPAQARHQGVEPLGINPHQYNASRTPSTPQDPNNAPYPWNLKRFYNMREGPWVPIVGSSDAHTGQQVQVANNYNSPAFQHFRSRPLPSECDTSPDDSGYGGSRPPCSIENASVYEGESNPEAQNAAVLIDGFHLCPPQIPTAQLTSWLSPQPPPSISTTSGETKHWCAECKTYVKTRSELNKHQLRHNKPFRCDVQGCSRKKGFGTKNDLDRHKRSVHSDLSVSGPRYVCRLDQCAIRDPLKIWPRADNFRSHLRRIHQRDVSPDADLKEYIYQDGSVPSHESANVVNAPGPSEPALREDLQGVGGMSYMINNSSTNMPRPMDASFPPPFLGNQSMDTDSGHDIREDLDSLLQNATSSSGDVQPPLDSSRTGQTFLPSNIPNESSQGSLQSDQTLNDQAMPFPVAGFRSSDGSEDVRGSTDISVTNDEDVEAMDVIAEPPGHSGDDDIPLATDASRLAGQETKQSGVPTTDTDEQTDPKSDVPSGLDILRLLRSETNSKILECLKQFPKHLLNLALNDGAEDSKSSSSGQDSTNQKNLHRCTECVKTFNRQCELKKHLKRHEKPYGCTFPNCSKTFGSKNDWKRHESSQHWQLETWKCEEMKPDQSEPCGKVCQRRESLKHHLSKEHAINDVKQVDEKLEKCRIGRHCDTRFWCGFCEKIVQIGEEGVNAWTKRCDHIDDHFCGRNGPKMNICKWKQLVNEDERLEKGRARANNAPSSKRSTSSFSSSSSASSGASPSLKRKTGAHGDTGRHKKQRQVETYMWICCECSGDNNLMTTKTCFHCDHMICEENCYFSMVAVNQEDEIVGA